MKSNIVKIISIEHLNSDVIRFIVQKPMGYKFIPGQATDVSINTPSLKNEKHPFTFTSLNDSEHLEFTIKIYYDHNGVTNALEKLKQGDELIISDSFGAIKYKSKGVFIAAGSGVTPFIAILRQLEAEKGIADNKLIYTNKTESDIILKEELEELLGDNFINTLTGEKKEGYDNRRIDLNFLKEKVTNFNQHFYVCGPSVFVKAISDELIGLGVKPSDLVLEK